MKLTFTAADEQFREVADWLNDNLRDEFADIRYREVRVMNIDLSMSEDLGAPPSGRSLDLLAGPRPGADVQHRLSNR